LQQEEVCSRHERAPHRKLEELEEEPREVVGLMDMMDVWTSPPACSPVNVTTAVCGMGLMMDKMTHWAGGLLGLALVMSVCLCSKRNTCRATALASVVEASPRLDVVGIEEG